MGGSHLLWHFPPRMLIQCLIQLQWALLQCYLMDRTDCCHYIPGRYTPKPTPNMVKDIKMKMISKTIRKINIDGIQTGMCKTQKLKFKVLSTYSLTLEKKNATHHIFSLSTYWQPGYLCLKKTNKTTKLLFHVFILWATLYFANLCFSILTSCNVNSWWTSTLNSIWEDREMRSLVNF